MRSPTALCAVGLLMAEKMALPRSLLKGSSYFFGYGAVHPYPPPIRRICAV